MTTRSGGQARGPATGRGGLRRDPLRFLGGASIWAGRGRLAQRGTQARRPGLRRLDRLDRDHAGRAAVHVQSAGFRRDLGSADARAVPHPDRSIIGRVVRRAPTDRAPGRRHHRRAITTGTRSVRRARGAGALARAASAGSPRRTRCEIRRRPPPIWQNSGRRTLWHKNASSFWQATTSKTTKSWCHSRPCRWSATPSMRSAPAIRRAIRAHRHPRLRRRPDLQRKARPQLHAQRDLRRSQGRYFDALVIPGGRAPEYLRLNPKVLDVVGISSRRQAGRGDLPRRADSGRGRVLKAPLKLLPGRRADVCRRRNIRGATDGQSLHRRQTRDYARMAGASGVALVIPYRAGYKGWKSTDRVACQVARFVCSANWTVLRGQASPCYMVYCRAQPAGESPTTTWGNSFPIIVLRNIPAGGLH